VSGVARNHFAPRRIWLCALQIFRPCFGRPSDSTVCSTSPKPPSGWARRVIPLQYRRLDENRFQISVALAGFKPDEVELTVEQNILTLESRKSEKDGKASRRATSSASLRSPTTLRSRAPASRMAYSSLTWCARSTR